MKEFIAVIVAMIVAFGIIIGFACCNNQCNNQKENDSYHNGICPICETPFHFVNITYVDYQGYKYIYACDNEHTIICASEQHAN